MRIIRSYMPRKKSRVTAKRCPKGMRRIHGKCRRVIKIHVFKGLVNKVEGLPKNTVAQITDDDAKAIGDSHIHYFYPDGTIYR